MSATGLMPRHFANLSRVWIDTGQVSFLGQRVRKDIPELLAQHDVILKTTRQEGFPNGVLEAMAIGVVPVCTRIQGVTDWIIKDRETGMLVPMGNAATFARSIEELHRHRAIAGPMFDSSPNRCSRPVWDAAVWRAMGCAVSRCSSESAGLSAAASLVSIQDQLSLAPPPGSVAS